MIKAHWYWLVATGITLCVIAPQLVRERLVEILRKSAPHLSAEVSDWTFGVNPGGYAAAIKREYVWGKRANELCRIDGIAKFIWLVRAIDVLGIALLVLAVAMLYWDLR